MIGRSVKGFHREQEGPSIKGTLNRRPPLERRARYAAQPLAELAPPDRQITWYRPLIHGMVLSVIALIVASGIFFARGGGGSDQSASLAPVDDATASEITVASDVDDTAAQTVAGETRGGAFAPLPARESSPAGPNPSGHAGPGEPAEPAVEPEPEPEPAYRVYQVQEGDTISGIGERFAVRSEYVVANNPELGDADLLSIGQEVVVPVQDGVLHHVMYGETLSDIAAVYDVEVEEIARFRANGIADPDVIADTQVVFVPDATLPPEPEPEPVIEEEPEVIEAEPVEVEPEVVEELPSIPEIPGGSGDNVIVEEIVEPVPTETPVAGEIEREDGSPTPTASPLPATPTSAPPPPPPPPPPAPGPAASTRGLIWPVNGGYISSYMGPRHPLGIDIAGRDIHGAPIVASTEGRVTFAGGTACCGYGYYVIVDSPAGIRTLYAHLSSIHVHQGQYVSQGQTLGIIGTTGLSTGIHLHFEVIDNGVRVNPLAYLPPR